MFIDPSWRILTIGDGDLSFSLSLVEGKDCKHVTASVLDTEEQVRSKYADNGVDRLRQLQVPVYFGLDITDPQSISAELYQSFDLTIFQFPLITAATKARDITNGQSPDTNLLNRNLLHCFLLNSARRLIRPDNVKRCYITSKDVKPYSHWHIETLAEDIDDLQFTGIMDFDTKAYSQYRPRNVERDKVIKDTRCETYIFSSKPQAYSHLPVLLPTRCRQDHCNVCGKGPFRNEADRHAHESGDMHRRLKQYQNNWQDFLQRDTSSA